MSVVWEFVRKGILLLIHCVRKAKGDNPVKGNLAISTETPDALAP